MVASDEGGLVQLEQADVAWLEQRLRRAAVDLHRRALGDWCPGLPSRRAHDVIAPNRLTTPSDAVVAEDPRAVLVLCSVCSREVST